jgi:hypothetical protein
MKKIYWTRLPAQTASTVLRFPVATLCCVTLFVTGISLINGWFVNVREIAAFKLNLLLPPGFILSIALRLLAEDLHWRGWRRHADAAVVPLLALCWHLLPGQESFTPETAACYTACCLAALTALSTAPCRSLANPALFWRYNMELLWKGLFAAACAAILLGGSCLALATVDALFHIHIADEWYACTACFFGLLFAPLFFAAGIPFPSQPAAMQEQHYTPLRILGQYILLPVITLFLLIFYAYGLKIAITWQLPEGSVAWMSLCYSAAGLLLYFLLHRFYITRATKTATLFGRYFFYSELPVIALLFVAIYRRTADYGLTENRYFLWAGALWLLGISLYMIFIKGRTFRPVLLSLACTALLSVTGPWSAFRVSECSQIRRLERLLTHQEWPQEGIAPDSTQITRAQENYRQIQAIKRYFENRGKPLPAALDTRCNTCEEQYNKHFGHEEEPATAYLEITTEEQQPLEITGYDRMYGYSYRKHTADETPLSAEDATRAWIIKGRPGGYIEIYRQGTLSTTVFLPDIARQITGIDWDTPPRHAAVTRQPVPVNARYAIVFIEIYSHIHLRSMDIHRADMYILEKKSRE